MFQEHIIRSVQIERERAKPVELEDSSTLWGKERSGDGGGRVQVREREGDKPTGRL